VIIFKYKELPKIWGEAKGLNGIDLVATKNYRERMGSCGTYRRRSTGATFTIRKEMNDKIFAVYDRRTGKKKASRLFRAPSPSCPTTLKSTKNVTSFADTGDVRGEKFVGSTIR